MEHDFRVGDLVVCVDSLGREKSLKKGVVYRVRCLDGLTVHLTGVPSYIGFHHRRFKHLELKES